MPGELNTRTQENLPILTAPETVHAAVSSTVANPEGLQYLKTGVTIPPIMEKIAFCESTNRQFNKDGSVVRGKHNPKDVGRFQINEKFHLAASKKLGMNIYTWEGNTAYALYLYKKNGTRDWNWSKPCWNK